MGGVNDKIDIIFWVYNGFSGESEFKMAMAIKIKGILIDYKFYL